MGVSHAAQARSTLHRQGPASTGCSLVCLRLGCSMYCLSALKSHELHQAEDRKAKLNLQGARSGVHTEPQTPHDTKSARFIKIDRQNIHVTRKRHRRLQGSLISSSSSPRHIAGWELHATEQVQAELPLWALVAKEAGLYEPWRRANRFLCMHVKWVTVSAQGIYQLVSTHLWCMGFVLLSVVILVTLLT